MFSSGNITEKLRIANMNCHGEVIVDLYAGKNNVIEKHNCFSLALLTLPAKAKSVCILH